MICHIFCTTIVTVDGYSTGLSIRIYLLSNLLQILALLRRTVIQVKDSNSPQDQGVPGPEGSFYHNQKGAFQFSRAALLPITKVEREFPGVSDSGGVDLHGQRR